MCIKKLFAAALACAALAGTAFVSEAVAQCDTWTTSTIRNCNGIDYELWNQNNRGNVSMRITGSGTNGSFTAQWSGTENVLFRSGKKWGSSSTTTAASLGNITFDFAATWQSGDNVKMLGLYGWAYYPSGSNPTRRENGQNATFSNQIEWYIIQDRGSYNPATNSQLCRSTPYGEATIDGILYEFRVCDRIDQPMLTGNGNFKQFFSIPKSTGSHRTSGVINVARHFQVWDSLGMNMKGPLYEIAMKVESYTGSSANSSGNATVSRSILTTGGSGPVDPCVANPNGPGCGSGGNDTPTALTWGGGGQGNILTSSWTLNVGEYYGDSKATGTVSGGNLTIDPITQGAEAWEPQLVQTGVNLPAGTYILTFDARAVGGTRDMEVLVQRDGSGGGDWTTYNEGSTEVRGLTTTSRTFTINFTMTSADPAAQLAFNLGGSNTGVILSNPTLVAGGGTTSILPGGGIVVRGGAPTVSVRGGTLNVLSPASSGSVDRGASRLTIRMVDTRGKVRASFNATGSGSFALTAIPAGRYFVEVRGEGIRHITPVVLK